VARIVFVIFLGLSLRAFADLLPLELSLNLRQLPSLSNSFTLLELEIKNQSNLNSSILVPGHPQLGLGLFEVQVYERRQTMKWTNVSNVELIISDSIIVDKNYMQFWSLRPGESFRQLFVLNIAPTPNLAFQVKYQPHVCTDYFSYAFRWYDQEGSPEEEAIEGDQRFKYQGPMFSNLCEVGNAIVYEMDQQAKHFYNGRWLIIKHQLKHKRKYPERWPVLSKQLYSQVVLSSLPTYANQWLVVETKKGIKIIILDYQIGKIYRLRAFFAKIAHLCGARKVFWRTSSFKSLKLIHFQVMDFNL
jgi:hypothetical protein